MKDQKRDIWKCLGKKRLAKRLLASTLALAVGVTFTPLMAVTVSAADASAKAGPGEVEVTSLPDIDLGEIDPKEFGDAVDVIDPKGSDLNVIDPEVTDPGVIDPESNGSNTIDPGAVDQNKHGSDLNKKGTLETATDENGGIYLTPKSNGELKVTGSLTRGTFTVLTVVDGNATLVGQMNINAASFEQTFDMTVLPIGKYYIVASNTARSTNYVDEAFSGIYDTPKNNASQYEVYSKYLFYTPKSPVNYRTDTDSHMYIDIKKKGAKKWKTYGPINSSKLDNKIKKLKPNKKYQARVYYGKKVSYTDGSSHFISGLDTGKYKKVTIKTAKKKLPIKSVSVKAVNVKQHNHIIPGHVLNNVGKETWYTYRLQVTVKMSKKPGVSMVYINGKKVKGNKKTYSIKTATQNSIYTGSWVTKPYRKYYKHTTAKIPRGTKYQVNIYSCSKKKFNKKTYKAYTPIQKRTTRLR